MMLRIVVATALCLLPSQVNALTALAKCLSGYEWMFSSTGQSPCDVAVELASACFSTTYQVGPLLPGYLYSGPFLGYINGCLCSSVYYSLLNACAFCQGQGIETWSNHIYNCTRAVTYLSEYPQQIPVGVKVPAYAYQDVSLLGRFNVSLAYNMKGVESSRPSSSTVTPTPTSSSSTSTTPTLSVSKAPSPGIIGGIVIGGLVGLGLIAALITFLVLRSKQKSRSQRPDTASFEKSPDMVISPDTATSLHTSLNYNANDQNAYNFADPNIYDPYRPNLSPHVTGNDSAQNHAHNSGRYSGMPEF